ncbi:MAG: primosomal protein N' [Alphaproteobacteria bacterium]|nr:primosomal protein N' [Alphaproteobacteria bacterium]
MSLFDQPPGESVSVLLPSGAPGPFDYANGGHDLKRGDIVAVPLGRREVLGVVWGSGTGEVAPERLKAVSERFEVPSLPPVLTDFVDWMAGYVIAPKGAVLSLCLRGGDALVPPRTKTLYRRGALEPVRTTPQRQRSLQAAADGMARAPAEFAELAGVGVSAVKGLIEAGALEPIEVPVYGAPPCPEPDYARVTLSEAQRTAADAMIASLGTFSATLLDGVTGSGKTETYFEAVAAVVREGGQVLILLPEIALTVQFMERFEARFGCRPTEWHSDVKSTDRSRAWRQVALGDARVVVGARSALFLPYPDLRLIIADEEHDAAYKQEDGVIYNARDMAVMRARMGHCPVVLASATPSLESWANAEQGRYRHLTLPARFGPAVLPTIELVDLRRDKPPSQRFLSPALEGAIEETIARKEQALLFLNRRGYAPLNICQSCGHRIACPNCSAWLVEHRFRAKLACHHCGFERPKPRECEKCHAVNAIASSGPGVERIAEEVMQLWPEARVAIASSDVLHGPKQTQEALERMAEGGIDILIGTQIVAKGHNFPNLTLVGVVDADLGLSGGDPRARERTFQLLHQVAGRAGRHAKPGRALLQTHQPEDRLMQAIAAGDRDRFLKLEATDRERLGFPPYGRFAALILSSADEAAIEAYADALARAAPRAEGATVWGPAPALMARLRGRTRLRFLVKTTRNFRIQDFVREWIAACPPPNKVRLAVDVDPQSFI